MASIIVDDIVVCPKEAVPDGVEQSLSENGLEIVGADFGEAKAKGTAVQTDKGIVLVNREPETRTVTLKLRVRPDSETTLPQAAHYLQTIVGALQSRDEWFRRDHHVGGDFGPSLFHVTGEVGLGDFGGWQVGACPDVILSMVCDFAAYSTEEVESEVFSTNTARELVYELPASEGTTKGLKRVRVTNEGQEDWRGLIWAEECRDYKPGDPTAEPVYRAVDLTPKGGAVIAAGPTAPEVRAVGTVASGAAAVSPGLPAGTEIGDLLIMVAESGGATAAAEANTALTAEGWASPPAPYAAQKKGNTRLTLLYRIATGTDATTTNDTGDHQVARIIGVKAGTFDAEAPFNVAAVGTQAATKAVSIPGATTTRDNCLILACASGNLPDANTTFEFGAPTNASLTELTERIDNTVTAGDGGALFAVTGVRASKGAYSATTLTALTEAERGVVSLAIAPPTYIRHMDLNLNWLAILGSETANDGHMTHRGVRRFIARAQPLSGEPQLRLVWRPLGASRWVEDNPIVNLEVDDDWQLYDLGECRPQAPIVGDERWEWKLLARSPDGSGSIKVRDVYPLPTEQYCLLREPYEAPPVDLQTTDAPGTVAESTATIDGKYGAGVKSWTTPENVKTSNNAWAKVGPSLSEPSKILELTNFGISPPEEAIPIGIVLNVEAHVGAKGWGLLVAALIVGGVIQTPGEHDSEQVHYLNLNSTSDIVYTENGGIGAAFWGLGSLSKAQLEASNFGVALQAAGTNEVQIDRVTIDSLYTTEALEDRVCFSSRSVELTSTGASRQHAIDEVWGIAVPDGFLPYDTPGGLEQQPSRGILVPSQGDLGALPDSGVTASTVLVRTRSGHQYVRMG